MTSGCFRFDRFLLDPADRRLLRDGVPVEINARYLDALALLVREQGRLVSKDRFLDEAWRGVPVTDEALTQCIKTLRRQLGDSATRPRFIETVPKHGYRFIAPVENVEGDESVQMPAAGAPPRHDWRDHLLLGAAGAMGGGVAGMIGGFIYGFGGASQPLQPGMGAASVLLVLLCLCILVGVVGGAGIGFGIAAAGLASARSWLWNVLGGAAGGAIVGGFTKLLGLDAFTLLFGRSPGDITGAAEGALLGAAVAFAAWLGRGRSFRRAVAIAAATGGAAGIFISFLGGRLMGGSLNLLASSFPGSRLRLDRVGSLFGESDFGPVSEIATSGLEGGLFGSCVVAAMLLARSSFGLHEKATNIRTA